MKFRDVGNLLKLISFIILSSISLNDSVFISDTFSFSKDSLSLELLAPKHALQRAKDYDLYIKEFTADYLKFGLRDKLNKLDRNKGLYWAAAGYQKEAYISFQMGGYKKLAFLSWFGPKPFQWGLLFLKYYQKKILTRG